VGLKSLKSLNLTNGYPNKNKKNNNKNNNKVKSKPLELFELAGKKDNLNRPGHSGLTSGHDFFFVIESIILLLT
jgi:hypothetical protein